MRYDPELAEGCQDRFLSFLHRTLDAPGVETLAAEMPRAMGA